MAQSDRIVEFGVNMQPAARIAIEGVPNDGGQAFNVFLKIMGMPIEERVSVVSGQAHDEMLVWFALLTPAERREFLLAAGRDLKLRLGDQLERKHDNGKR